MKKELVEYQILKTCISDKINIYHKKYKNINHISCNEVIYTIL